MKVLVPMPLNTLMTTDDYAYILSDSEAARSSSAMTCTKMGHDHQRQSAPEPGSNFPRASP